MASRAGARDKCDRLMSFRVAIVIEVPMHIGLAVVFKLKPVILGHFESCCVVYMTAV